MPSRILKELFDQLGIEYEMISHPRRETALETADAAGEWPGHVAKVVVAKAKGKDLMFVIPANRRLDLFKAEQATGAQDVRVEFETEISSMFPDSELGAMPPFGSLYEMPCYFDEALTAYETIVFNAGTHTESFKMKTDDYITLANPIIGDYSAFKTKANSRRPGPSIV